MDTTGTNELVIHATLEYYQGKTLNLYYEYTSVLPHIEDPSDVILDGMSDEEYLALENAYINFYRRFWSSSCLYIPRRKTPAERTKEALDHENFIAIEMREKEKRYMHPIN